MARRTQYPTPSQNPTPILDKLMAEKLIKMDFRLRAYYGTNAEGVELILGTMGGEDELERYLVKHPTPNEWRES